MPTFAVVAKGNGLIENLIVAESQEVADKSITKAYLAVDVTSRASEPILGKTYDLELNIIIEQEETEE